MKLPEFGLLTDENINPIVAAELRAMGFDVFDVCENGLFGSEDTVLLSRARADGRVVVTHDSDFGTLAVAHGTAGRDSLPAPPVISTPSSLWNRFVLLWKEIRILRRRSSSSRRGLVTLSESE